MLFLHNIRFYICIYGVYIYINIVKEKLLLYFKCFQYLNIINLT